MGIRTWKLISFLLLLCAGVATYAIYFVDWTPDPVPTLSKKFDDAISAMVFSPDGKSLCLAHGNTISILSPSTFEEIHAFPALEDEINALAFSRSGRTLASGGLHGQLVLWDMELRNKKAVLQPPVNEQKKKIASLCFSPDESLLAAPNVRIGMEVPPPKLIQIWDLKSNKVLRNLEDPYSDVQAAEFSHDGKMLLSGDKGGRLIVWDTEKWTQSKDKTASHEIVTVCFRPNLASRVIAYGEAQGLEQWCVVLLDVESDSIKFLPAGDGAKSLCHVIALNFSRDGALLAAGEGIEQDSSYRVKLWELKAAPSLIRQIKYRDEIVAVSISPDGRNLVVACRDRKGEGFHLDRWDVSQLKPQP